MSTTMEMVTSDTERAEALAGRLFEALVGYQDLATIYIGEKLGFYRSLAAGGPATSTELAERTGTAERYVREWLEQQAVTGFLQVENPGADAQERRFSLPAAYVPVLVDEVHPSYMGHAGRAVTGSIGPIAQLLEAFRTGAGVPYEAYGQDMIEGQAAFNRPAFTAFLGSEWLPAMPDVHQVLSTKPGARIADVGMGGAWSSIAMAKAFPNVQVDGFDLDAASVDMANANIAAEGLSDRVRAFVRDAGDPALAGQYDLACAFECIHDMSDPVSVLRSIRRLVSPNGTVLVMDEKVADEFTAPGDDVERFMYGWSVLHCLPVGMAETPSVATGTVMRSSTMRRFAEEAGFTRFEILPIENDFFRFYRLDG
jgi:2-polyprenyl-3-methyl-5-hydroxy-6-metoxy-1,4-benzoquinol methylase